MVKNQQGRRGKGKEFYDREERLAQIGGLLEDGKNLLLLAPRRVGKTSLMGRIKDQAREHGFIPAFASVADVTAESEFIKRLYRTIQEIPEGKEPVAIRLVNVAAQNARGATRSTLDQVLSTLISN